MAIYWDDILLLRALDELEHEDRAYSTQGDDLLQKLAAGRPVSDQDRLAFIRLLHLLYERGRLLFEQQSQGGAHIPQPHESYYLNTIWHFQLTETGRDRAQGRVVLEGLPDPDEDDGRTIPALVLDRVAHIVARWYSIPQLEKFFHDCGLAPSDWKLPEEGPRERYAFDLLAALEDSDSEDRRTLRQFLAAFLNGALPAAPEPDEYQQLSGDLGKAGWKVRDDRIVICDPVHTAVHASRVPVAPESSLDLSASIFVVHGHAHARLQEVSRFIERITGREVVILHEKPNKGQTLIEKFEANAEKAAHAVVLLTADDIGRAASDHGEGRRRGRQNVVLELGFFFGKLGRGHVTVLRDPEVEEPSDIHGLVYIPLDQDWKLALIRELEAAGIQVDLSRIT